MKVDLQIGKRAFTTAFPIFAFPMPEFQLSTLPVFRWKATAKTGEEAATHEGRLARFLSHVIDWVANVPIRR